MNSDIMALGAVVIITNVVWTIYAMAHLKTHHGPSSDPVDISRVAIDSLGLEGMVKELEHKGWSPESAEIIAKALINIREKVIKEALEDA